MYLESLKTHVFIELFYGRQIDGLLDEHTSEVPIEELNKQFGVFKGCSQIADRIKSSLERNSLGIGEGRQFDINNFFINKANVYVVDIGKSKGQYSFEETTVKNGKFDEITIYVNYRLIGKNGLKAMLMHELTHAWEDFNLRKKGSDIYQVNQKRGYWSNVEGFKNADDAFERKVRQMIYLFNRTERNGHIAQLQAEIEPYKKKIRSARETVDLLYKTKTYKDFEEMFDLATELYNEKDTDKQQQILDIYNSNVEKQYQIQEYKDFKHWLKLMKYKTKGKLDDIIPKIACESIRFPKYFPNLLDLMSD